MVIFPFYIFFGAWRQPPLRPRRCWKRATPPSGRCMDGVAPSAALDQVASLVDGSLSPTLDDIMQNTYCGQECFSVCCSEVTNKPDLFNRFQGSEHLTSGSTPQPPTPHPPPHSPHPIFPTHEIFKTRNSYPLPPDPKMRPPSPLVFPYPYRGSNSTRTNSSFPERASPH